MINAGMLLFMVLSVLGIPSVFGIPSASASGSGSGSGSGSASVALAPPAVAMESERLPVIFSHGVGVPAPIYEDLLQIQRVFARLGYRAYVARTPVADTLERRAAILREEIRRLVPQGRFHIVGHSMGGLDARLLVHQYGMGDRVASITSLATPHRGTAVADALAAIVGTGFGTRVGVRSIFGELLDFARACGDATYELTRAHMAEFNAEVIDDPRVRYFSMNFYIPGRAINLSRVPLLWLTHPLIQRSGDSMNDGMVGVESSRWGEDLGTYPADHFSETAPIPFPSGLTYEEIIEKVLANLDRNFLSMSARAE